jgi:hypothetical protein
MSKIDEQKKEVVGTQMANLLFYIKDVRDVPIHIRMQAKELYKKWDRVCDLRFMNPFTAIEMSKKLGI